MRFWDGREVSRVRRSGEVDRRKRGGVSGKHFGVCERTWVYSSTQEFHFLFHFWRKLKWAGLAGSITKNGFGPKDWI